MDCRALDFDAGSFDLVIDKATTDTMLCSGHAYMNVAKMLAQVHRVLKLGGTYVLVSTGDPKERLLHLQRNHVQFKVTWAKLERHLEGHSETHYVYMCQKESQVDDNWEAVRKQIAREEAASWESD